jgi:hypothetical protein
MTTNEQQVKSNEYACYYIKNGSREFFWSGRPSTLRVRYPYAKILCTGPEAIAAVAFKGLACA